MTSLLIQHLVTTTLLASLVWVVCRLAKPAPAARHILWSLVILKLMIPPMGEVGINVPTLSASTSPIANTPARQEPRPPLPMTNSWEGEAPAEPLAPSTKVERTDPIATTTSTSSMQSTTSTPPTSPPSQPTPINWQALAIAAWLCGAIAMAALQLIRWQRFTAQTTASAETPEWLHDEAETVAKRLGCKAVPVTVCNRLSTPAVAGVLKPRILVPSALLERLPRERWRALLTHELAHVKRHDTWWRMLELASGIIWFWNPVFWFARKNARITAEHACDAWVVWALPKERRAYADSLVDVSEWASTPNLPATAIGMSAASREKLETRLTSIIAGKISRQASSATRIAAAMLLAASLPGWAIEEEVESTSSTKSTPSTESNPLQVAQTETKTQAAKTKSKTVQPISDRTTQALKEPVSIGFDGEHIQTILEFLSEHIGVNIVLDHSVVASDIPQSVWDEMDIVRVGTHPYRHPKLEHLGTTAWPKGQAVDGMVDAFDGNSDSVKEVLDTLLPDAGMTYAITPDCIWITVTRSEFEINDPILESRNWAWLQPNSTILPMTAPVSNLVRMLEGNGRPTNVRFSSEPMHITQLVELIHKRISSGESLAKVRPSSPILPIVVDAMAISPPPKGPLPKSYLIASTFENKWNTAQKERKRSTNDNTVTSGNVPFIKLQDIPLGNALTALLRPLNMTYVLGPDFIYVTSAERAANVEFSDSHVPTDQTQLGKILDEPTSIEFDDEHIATILELLSEDMGVNIVLDSRAVIPESAENYSATGTNPVTNGHVPFVHVNDLRLADTLKALLTPLDLDYSIGPGFLWVSSPELIAQDSRTVAGAAPSAPKQRAAKAESSRPMPRPAAPVRAAPATVTPPRKPGIVFNGYRFRRITRWEDSSPRVEVEVDGDLGKWYEIGDTVKNLRIADIDIYMNQVIINYQGELRILQLAWSKENPFGRIEPRRSKTSVKTTSRWTWIDVPYGNVKFGPIARWENSDPRLKVEFSDGHRKWLEEDAIIGNARILEINIIANEVTVRTPEGDTHLFQLPQPVQVTTAPLPKRSTKQRTQPTWTPVDYGNVTIGRIARWEESRDEQVEIEFADGERKWLEVGQSAAGITIVSIDILKNRVTLTRNGTTEIVQLP